jgi:molybdenum cofactor cytidylyltransferase
MFDLSPDRLSPHLPLLPAVRMTPRLVAIIPAAGHSRRMGEPKLLLEFGGQSVLSRVVQTLHGAGLSRCLVVVRPDDLALAGEAERAGAEVVVPVIAPSDMRYSVECGLRHVLPATPAYDGWILVPADHPTLNPDVIRNLITAWQVSPTRIVVPVYQGRRGHPTVFPWGLVPEILALPPECGLNQLLRSQPARVLEVSVSDRRVLDDLDTPEDWERLLIDYQSSIQPLN